MRYGNFLSALSLASSHSGGVPSSVWHMAGGGHVRVKAARPNIRVYGACAVFRCVLVRIMAAYSKRGAILMRDSGCSL